MSDTEKTVTHRRVLTIAIPIVISNATVPILGAVDTGVVGQLGQAAPIGAVGVGAVVLSAIYWIFGFLRMGTTGLAAQAIGAKDHNEVSALLVRALLVGGGAGVVFIAFQSVIFAGAFAISPASEEVETLARQYMAIRVWSAPAAIALYGITGWLIAAERTRAVLVIQVVMNGANILLDLWFVLGLDLGVSGVAYATVIAEWSGLIIGLWFCRDAFAIDGWRDPALLFNKVRLWQMASLNRDILIRSLALQLVMISFLFYGAKLGDLELAANQILLQFLQITAFALDGFAFAAEAIVGQAVGARAPKLLRKGVIYAAIWCGVVAVLLALVFWVFGPLIIDIMTTAPDIRIEAREYLIYMVFAPILGIGPWMLDGVFIGATRARDMRNMMVVSVAVYFAALYALTPMLGNHGLWIALLISYVARGVTLALRYPALEQSVRP